MELRRATQEWENRFGKIFELPNVFQEIFLKPSDETKFSQNLVEIFKQLNNNLRPDSAENFALLLIRAYGYSHSKIFDFAKLRENIESYLRNVYSRDNMVLKLKWFEQQRLSIIAFVNSACLLFDAIPISVTPKTTPPAYINVTNPVSGSVNASCLFNNQTNTSLCLGEFSGSQIFTFPAYSYPNPGIGWWKIGVAVSGLCAQFFFPWFVNLLFGYHSTSTTNIDEMISSASYLLAAYIVCERTQSEKNWMDRFAPEDFPCQVAIGDAAYSCKKSKTSNLSKLIIKSLERMKE